MNQICHSSVVIERSRNAGRNDKIDKNLLLNNKI